MLHEMTLGPRWHDVHYAQSAEVQSIDECMVLGEDCRESSVSARALGILSGTFRSS